MGNVMASLAVWRLQAVPLEFPGGSVCMHA